MGRISQAEQPHAYQFVITQHKKQRLAPLINVTVWTLE